MKGYLILTEGRSGSNWLGSLAKNTGKMGIPGEWIDHHLLGVQPSDYSPSEYFELVINRGRSGNDRFGVKIFPRHFYWVLNKYDFDFVAECQDSHDIKLIFLCRKDRMKQAISFARGKMTSQWKSTSIKQGEERYDFNEICRAYFYIEQSYAFWRAYLNVRNLAHEELSYEDLISDPSPFIRILADHLQVEAPSELRTDLKIQRDDVTEEWMQRFEADMAGKNGLESAAIWRPASRTPENLMRFFRKKPPLQPLHY